MASQSTQASAAYLAQELTSHDLALVCNTLHLVASKCFALGHQLGVEESRLCTIKDNSTKYEDQLNKIISERLKQDSPLTWYNIVTALRAPAVGEYILASQIEQKYLLKSPTSVHPQITSTQKTLSVRALPDSYSRAPMRTRGHYKSQSPEEGLTERGHCRSRSPVRGLLDRQHYPSYVSKWESPTQGIPHVSSHKRPLYQATYSNTASTLLSSAPATRPLQESGQWDSQSCISLDISDVQSQRKCMDSCSLPLRRSHLQYNPELPYTENASDSSKTTDFRLSSSTSLTTASTSSRGDTHILKKTSIVAKGGKHMKISIPFSKLPIHNFSLSSKLTSTSNHNVASECGSETTVRIPFFKLPSHCSQYLLTLPSLSTTAVGCDNVSAIFDCDTSFKVSIPVSKLAHNSSHSFCSHQACLLPTSTTTATATTSPGYDTHELKYIDVVNQHSDVLTETISGDLTFFINKFIELGFVTRTATANVLSQHGVGNGGKAGQLLSLLTAHYNRACNKKKWFEKLVGVFSSEPAYKDLTDMITTALKNVRSDHSSPAMKEHNDSQSKPLFKSPMQQFVDYLKDTYQQSRIERSLDVLKWPPTPSKVFISLACIDRKTVISTEEADDYTRAMINDGNIDVVLNKKERITFADIGKGLPVTNSSERVILVEGAPGVGKSTFAWEFCRRWERGEIAQQYQLVLLLRLRDERMGRANSLRDLISHPSKIVCEAIVEELISTLGMKTLIILEGFDELAYSQRIESSIFLQLILGQLLLHATVMITSRPWATGALMRKIVHRVFQHIEVLGFTEENVGEYVKSVFSEANDIVGGPDQVSKEAKKNIDDTMTYLHTYPQIKACMYIPLNAAIVVSIHQESKKGKCILPKTLTELYYALTQVLLLRYLYGHAHYSEQVWNINYFEKDLPDEVYKQLLAICKVAYNGICTKGRDRIQLIFSDHDLGGCETLGFMQSVAEVYVKHGQKMSHNFLHLTIQEFLAAFIISKMSSAEQLQYLQRHKDGRLRVVLRFVAGLTKLNEVTPDQLRSLLGEPTVEQSDEQRTPYCNPMRPDVCVSVHHTNWLFEAQNSELLQSLFHNHTASFTFTIGMLPLEYYAVGYCIAQSHIKWSLTFEKTDEEKLSMLLKGAYTGDLQQCRLVTVRTIHSMSSKNLNLLLTSFCGVEELYLRFREPLSLPHLSALRILELRLRGISSDISAFSLPVLESLKVIRGTYNAISTNTKKNLCKFLSSNSLVHFHFEGKVSDQGMEEMVQSLFDNTAPKLKSLRIESDCSFTTTASECVSKIITRSTALQYLKISIYTFKDIDIFAKGLNDNVALPLKSLDVNCKCTFTTLTTTFLVQFITRSTTLQYIRLCHVTFSAQGLIELTKAIHHCSRLQEKKLEKLLVYAECSEDIVNLKHLIKDHPDMKKNIDWERLIAIVLSSIEVNKMTASTLNLAFECSHTTCFDLKNESISDAGVVALAQALHHNSTLKELHLSNKSISDAGTEALAQALHCNTTLERLYLSNNCISEAGAVALAQALRCNSALKVLDLDEDDAIGKNGTRQLVQALTVNTSIWDDGVRLPRSCEKYATKCTRYKKVKDKILRRSAREPRFGMRRRPHHIWTDYIVR